MQNLVQRHVKQIAKLERQIEEQAQRLAAAEERQRWADQRIQELDAQIEKSAQVVSQMTEYAVKSLEEERAKSTQTKKRRK